MDFIFNIKRVKIRIRKSKVNNDRRVVSENILDEAAGSIKNSHPMITESGSIPISKPRVIIDVIIKCLKFRFSFVRVIIMYANV